MLRKGRGGRRKQAEVNASSMADIAFLLLIFFLVTTTILEDKGVLVLLPPWSEDEPETEKMRERNVYGILVNANNQLLVREQPVDIKRLRENTKEFISNPKQRADLAENPRKAIISLKHDRGTKYKTYLAVYNEIKAAYRELRDTEAEKKYGKKYEYLARWQRDSVRNAIPLIISEAEPTEFGSDE